MNSKNGSKSIMLIFATLISSSERFDCTSGIKSPRMWFSAVFFLNNSMKNYNFESPERIMWLISQIRNTFTPVKVQLRSNISDLFRCFTILPNFRSFFCIKNKQTRILVFWESEIKQLHIYGWSSPMHVVITAFCKVFLCDFNSLDAYSCTQVDLEGRSSRLVLLRS